MKQFLAFFFLIAVFSSVNAQVPEDDTDTVMTFHAVTVILKPRDGMNNFKLRWLDYLYVLKEAGQLDKATYSGYVFNLIVERDGSLHLADKTVPTDTVISRFIKQERRWSIGIMSGRPISSFLKLKVPKELFKAVEQGKLIIQRDLVIQGALMKDY
jgi:hypothetical protein